MAINSRKSVESVQIPKAILITCQILQRISPKLVVFFIARLFTTPIRHKIPKREHELDRKSRQRLLYIPKRKKNVMVYESGSGHKKILLVHGWSGRGTQLFKFAEAFMELDYTVISFDAPAHGKSPGKTTLMPEFIATILELNKQVGPFEAAVGHSLGGMSLLNAVKRGLPLQRLVVIGSGDIVKDIMDDFVQKLGLKPKISTLLKQHFEKRGNETMDQYSSYMAARECAIPVLVIHDEDDAEVSVKCAHHIYENLPNGELLITHKLGHRKILGNQKVLQKTINFITSPNEKNAATINDDDHNHIVQRSKEITNASGKKNIQSSENR